MRNRRAKNRRRKAAQEQNKRKQTWDDVDKSPTKQRQISGYFGTLGDLFPKDGAR